VVAIVFYGAICAGLILGTATITVTDSHFVAGRAKLPISAIGDVRAFTGAEAILQRGQKLDARAWLLIRGWIAPVVTIAITDAEDPTPYWLVSTRRPQQLVAALNDTVTGAKN
jgi:hypothetical protein